MAENRIGYQPGESERNNVISYLREHVLSFPGRVALSWVNQSDIARWQQGASASLPHQKITYGEFAALTDSIASRLIALGIRKGDRVIIFLPMGVMMYGSMFAVQQIGAIAVFLDSWARRNHLGASASCVAPAAMISHHAAFELVKQVPEFSDMKIRIIAGPGEDASYTARLEEMMRSGGHAPLAAVEPEFTALITFTTGSSGTPKGANRTHRFLSAQHEALSAVIPYAAEDSDLPAFPIFSLNNLASGVTTIIPALDLASPSEKDRAALTAQIQQERITCTTLSPSMFNSVSAYCRENGIQLKTLRRVVTGGAPISKDNIKSFIEIAPQAQVWVFYGSTEVEPIAHIEGREMLASSQPADPEIVENGVNVGRVDKHLRFKFIRIMESPIDAANAPLSALEVEPGKPGELIVAGEHVCRNYYNNEEAFKRAKIVDSEGVIWHRTGDLARLDSSGYLWMLGRVHSVIERGGEYVFPVQAEIVLKRLSGVRQAAFMGMSDKELGEKTAAVIEAEGSSARERLAKEAGRLLNKNGIPLDSVYFVDKIPMDPRHHSKVEYEKLRSMLTESQAQDYVTWK